MKKTIDSAMTVFLGLVVGSLFFFALQVEAEPPNFNQYDYRQPAPPPQKQESSASTAIDDLINIILEQGFAGAIILILGIWTFKTDKANRFEQKEQFNKYIELNTSCNSVMSTVATRLENIEREVEATKQLQLLTSRNG